MRKLTVLTMATLVAFQALIPVLTTDAEARSRRGLGIAAGVLVGVAALAIIANSNRANASGRRSSCERWIDRCNQGSNRSCDRACNNGCLPDHQCGD